MERGRAGSYQLDGSDYSDIFNTYESMLDNRYMDNGSYGMRRVNYQHLCTLPTSYTSYQLDLKIYKSGIDPNFVVFVWKLPTLSSSDINDNTTAPFFFHNFTSSVFDLDYYNLGTISRIDSYNSTNMTSGNQKPYLDFYTHLLNIDGGRRSVSGDMQAIISTIVDVSILQTFTVKALTLANKEYITDQIQVMKDIPLA